MKVIQLCGTNGVGKTTCVLQFVENNQLVPKTISIGKKNIDYHWNEEKNGLF